MKLTTFLLIIVLVQASAKSFSQQITLHETNAPLEKIINTIEKQSGYVFIYTEPNLKNEKITVKLSKASLEDALKACFNNIGIDYKIVGENIVLKKKESHLIDPAQTINDQIVIGGMVTDELGKPLQLVTVKLKNSNIATSTDSKGYFTIKVPDEKSIISFSSVGYEMQELRASVIQGLKVIVLKTATTELKIVEINKGLYSTSKELNTGSVGTLTGADIAKQPVGDPLMALEGRIPGLYVSQATGVPGAALNVNIRGLNSIANGTAPLYIVNGIPFNSQSLSIVPSAAGYQNLSPFMSIRPSDIESIDVLKDADATAIYGSRGANGVILITTKKGKAGQTKLDVNFSQGVGKVTKMIPLMNTEQYLQMRNEVYKNDVSVPSSSVYDLTSTRYTDWEKLLIGNSSRVTDAKATLSGGNTLTQFLMGFGYRRETDVFPGDFSNKIASVNLNLNHESENHKFRANFSAGYTNNNNNLPSVDFTGNIFLPPNTPALYDAAGNLNFENGTFNNPYAGLLRKVSAVNDALVSNLNLNYKIIKDLNVELRLGYNTQRSKEVNLVPLTSYNPASIFSPALQRNNYTGINSFNTWTVEPQVNYRKFFGGHHIDLLAGGTFQQNLLDGVSISASGFSSDALLDNLGAATSVSNSIRYSQYRYNAIFARLGYNYNEKYILNLTARRDGSSKFGQGKRFGNFGSVGAAWLFYKENWIASHLPLLSFGKLRASIGRTGNDQTDNYRYLSTYQANGGYFGSSALQPTGLANDQFSWETINKIEAALELGFFNNKILLNTAFYRNRTSNQLVGYPLAGITGFSTVVANLPAVIENKGFEFDITTQNIKNKDFLWTTSANLTIPTNELLSFPNLAGSSYASVYAIGQPLTTKLVYKYNGIDPVKGTYTFEDLNRNGQLDLTGSFDKYFIFSGQRYFGGLNNTFNYKSLSLSFFMQYVNQTGYRLVPPSSPGAVGVNQPAIYFDRWQAAGDQPKYQKYSVNFPANNAFSAFMASDASIVDASFIRMKNVSLSWQIPNKVLQRLNVKGAQIFVQCQNLFTITKYEGLDPETQSSNGYPTLPTLRMITCGAQISL